MGLSHRIIQKTGQHKNPVTYVLLNSVFKERFFKAFYGGLNGSQRDWQGKRACFSLSFDCDYSEDVQAIPELLELLDNYSIKASFACIGKLIEQYPAVHQQLISQGHEIMNHTHTHPPSDELNSPNNFHKLGVAEQYAEIERCDRVCQDILNYKPTGFRIPHYGFQYTETIYGILKELGYVYSSSLKAPGSPSFGLPYYAQEGILEFPMTTCPQHPYNAFDTWHAFHAGKHDEAAFYDLFQQIIEIGLQCGAFLNLYFDPKDVIETKETFNRTMALLNELRAELLLAKYEDLTDWQWQ